MSINVFKKHPSNKIRFSNRAILCGELEVMVSRPKVIFCVHGIVAPGSAGCMTCCLLYITSVNSLSSASATIVLRQFCGAVHKGQNGCDGG